MIASPKAKSHGLGGGGGAFTALTFISAANAGVANAAAANNANINLFIFQPLSSVRALHWASSPSSATTYPQCLSRDVPHVRTNAILRKSGKQNRSPVAEFLCAFRGYRSKESSCCNLNTAYRAAELL